jgi:hypothetical protein
VVPEKEDVHPNHHHDERDHVQHSDRPRTHQSKLLTPVVAATRLSASMVW